MKNCFYTVFCAVFILLCLFGSLGAAIPSLAGSGKTEPLPTYIQNGMPSRAFGSSFEAWFARSFAGRDTLVRSLQTVRCAFGCGNSQVTVGGDGFLFYQDTLLRYTGSVRMTDAEIDETADALLALAESCRAAGIAFLFVPVPDKCTVYTDMLPPHVKAQSGPGELDRLLAALAARAVPFLDLRPQLRAAAETDAVYYRTDTHWTPHGALLAYRAAMTALGREPFDFEATLPSISSPAPGDLYALLYPGAATDEVAATPDYTGLYAFTAANAAVMDLTLEARSDGDGSLLMFRDSFANAWIAPFATSFSHSRFERTQPFMLSLCETEQPDCVIVELAERNLSTLASALAGNP